MSVESFMLTMSVSCFMWFLPHRRSVSTTDGLHRPGVLCVFLCYWRKLKAPQRHIDNTVVYSYFHSDILFLAVYLLCSGVLLFGWYFDYLKNETTAKAVYLLCSCTLPHRRKEAGHRPPPARSKLLCVIAKCIYCLLQIHYFHVVKGNKFAFVVLW